VVHGCHAGTANKYYIIYYYYYYNMMCSKTITLQPQQLRRITTIIKIFSRLYVLASTFSCDEFSKNKKYHIDIALWRHINDGGWQGRIE